MKARLALVAALSLTACSEVANTATELSEKVDAAIDEKAVVGAAASAVDLNAAKAQAESVARHAVNEALPTDELAAVGAVVDEAALINSIDKAVDGKAIGAAARDAVNAGAVEASGKKAE